MAVFVIYDSEWIYWVNDSMTHWLIDILNQSFWFKRVTWMNQNRFGRLDMVNWPRSLGETDPSDWLFRLAKEEKQKWWKQAINEIKREHFQYFHIFKTTWPSGMKQVKTNWSIWFIFKIVSFVYDFYIRSPSFNFEWRIYTTATWWYGELFLSQRLKT